MTVGGSGGPAPAAEGREGPGRTADQWIEAREESTLHVAGRDIYHIVGHSDHPARARPITMSVEPPLGGLDVPLRGRDKLIAEIFDPDGDPSSRPGGVHILYGLGGCGKSKVALEIARQARLAGYAVWWVAATGPARIGASMREIACRLGAPLTQIEHAWSGSGRLPTDLVWDLLNTAAQPWLLIFDNADDPRQLAPYGGRVSDGNGWVRQPLTAGRLVLVTTRDGDRQVWGTWAVRHAVRPLAPDAAGQVLLDVAGDRAGDRSQAEALGKRLGGLPLALRAAGHYLELVTRVPMLPGTSAIRSFDGYRDALDRRSARSPDGSTTDHPDRQGIRLVHDSFGPSLELFAARGQSVAVVLLRVLACLADAPIPFAALLDAARLSASRLFPVIGADQIREALDALLDLGFLDATVLESADDPAYAEVRSLHPLVRDMVREHEELHQHRSKFDALVMGLLNGAASGLDPDLPAHWSSWSVLSLQCAGSVLDYLISHRVVREPATVRQALTLVRSTARYLLAAGQPRECEIFLRRCLQAVAGGIDTVERQMLALRHELGRTALEQGRPAEAEQELRQVITARERLLGPKHPDTLASRHKLARAIMEQRQWTAAEKELRGIVAAERKVRGHNHPDTLTIRHSLARAMLAQGRAVEAEREVRAVLAVRQPLSGEEHPETVGLRNSLIKSLLAQQRLEEADRELRVALAGVSHERYVNRPEVLALRHTLAHLKRVQGHMEEAAAELRSLISDRRRILGDTHPDTMESVADLAALGVEPAEDQ